MSKPSSNSPTPTEWEALRSHFSSSAFTDTELSILGQNAGLSWYFKGHDETPRKYLQYDFEELCSVPGLVGKKSRVRRLMDIMQATLAFDEPFAEMADSIKTDIDAEADPNRILLRLQIDPGFPSALLHFDAASKALLFDESLETLGHLLAFVDRHAARMDLPEDCKTLLNCLFHRDEICIARYLPYRVGGKGLHLAESIGLIARELPPTIQYALLKRAGIALKDVELSVIENLDPETYQKAVGHALARIAVACGWFSEEAVDLKEKVAAATATERFFVPLNHPHIERVAAVLARMHCGVDPASGKRSLISTLLNPFHKK